MATRASFRRRCAEEPPKAESSKNQPRGLNSDPSERQQKRRRRRSSTPAQAEQWSQVGGSHSQPHAALSTRPTTAAASATDLTWQQLELLRQHRVGSHRRSRSAVSAQPTSLPALRFTTQGEIVVAAASADPLERPKARRSLPSHTSKSNRASSTSDAEPKPRRRSAGPCASPAAQGQAYAEPSCFRAPLPETLPLPGFARSVKSLPDVRPAQLV